MECGSTQKTTGLIPWLKIRGFGLPDPAAAAVRMVNFHHRGVNSATEEVEQRRKEDEPALVV